MKSVQVHIQLSCGFFCLTHVMERAKAHFQMKTNLQDAWSEDIHYKVMQRSKNRNKTGYLRHWPTHTHLRPLGTHRDTHTVMMTTWFDRWYQQITSDTTERGRSYLHILAIETKITDAPCTVWAEEAATWSTPTVIFRRTTSGRRRATRHVGWAWSLKRDHNTSMFLLEMWTLQMYYSIWYWDKEWE